MQFNAIYTRSGYSRPSEEKLLLLQQEKEQQEGRHEQEQQQQQQQQQQKPYLRCSSLSPAPLWIINRLRVCGSGFVVSVCGLGLWYYGWFRV